MIIENCASGGNRIDLELLRRSHTMWINDYTGDAAIVRHHLHGLNTFIPGNYQYIAYTDPVLFQKDGPLKDTQLNDLDFQSLFGGAFGFGAPVHRWSDSMKAQARRQVQTWKQLRRYLIEDYYPLSPQPTDMASWSGWQFHDPKDQSGFIQTFRTRTPDGRHRFVMHGLEEHAQYRLTDVYGSETFEITGGAAMTTGLEVTEEPMSSKVFIYKKVSRQNLSE